MAVNGLIAIFSAWDYVVLAAVLVISAAIGLYHGFAHGGQRTTSQFLIGERAMTAIPVSMSLTSSFMSAVTILGSPADVYRYGAIYALFAISYTIVSIITAEIFLPVFYRLGITSTYEYLELRFNRVVRICGTLVFMIEMILYTGIVIYAPALALNQVTGFNLWGAVVITGAVCTFYCALGGLKAVIWTDVFQIVIMVAGFVAVIARAVVVQGGIRRIIDDSYEGGRLNFWNFDPQPLQRHTFWTIVVGGTFTWTSIYGVNQAQVQRYVSCKTRFHAKMALYLNLVGLWVILVCVVLSGLCLYSVYRDCDPWTANIVTAPDQLLPYLVMDILHNYPGLPGLFVACAYCGTLSTVSATINGLAGVTVEDLIKPCFPSLTDRKLAWMAKGASVFFGAVCIGMSAAASYMGSVIQAALSIFGMVGGPLLGLFCLGILFPCANSPGAIVGLITGFCISLWVGIGGQLYIPPPERRLPLNLSTAGCNFSNYDINNNWTSISNWTSTTAVPTVTPLIPMEANERPAIADYWYSMSYLHLGTIGVLVVVVVGLAVSLVTGGAKQNIDRKYLHCTEDFSFDIFAFCRRDKKDKTEDLDLSTYSDDKQEAGSQNTTFQHDKMQFPEKGKTYNVHDDIQVQDHVIPPFSANPCDKAS
ncbi:sodium-coupled monocarboxylate transporter 1-like [Lissotriton helveticus]